MQEKSLIKKNILKFLDFKGVSKYKFYQDTGITRGVLDQNNGMSEENTTTFLAYFPEISPEWLLTGKGSMFREAVDAQPSAVAGESELKDEIIALQKRYIDMLEAKIREYESAAKPVPATDKVKNKKAS